MGKFLFSLAFATALLAVASSEASANFVCQAGVPTVAGLPAGSRGASSISLKSTPLAASWLPCTAPLPRVQVQW
jgi:hypothetical protein